MEEWVGTKSRRKRNETMLTHILHQRISKKQIHHLRILDKNPESNTIHRRRLQVLALTNLFPGGSNPTTEKPQPSFLENRIRSREFRHPHPRDPKLVSDSMPICAAAMNTVDFPMEWYGGGREVMREVFGGDEMVGGISSVGKGIVMVADGRAFSEGVFCDCTRR